MNTCVIEKYPYQLNLTHRPTMGTPKITSNFVHSSDCVVNTFIDSALDRKAAYFYGFRGSFSLPVLPVAFILVTRASLSSGKTALA